VQALQVTQRLQEQPVTRLEPLIEKRQTPYGVHNSYSYDLVNIPKNFDDAFDALVGACEEAMDGIEPCVSKENSGIGPYEYWGQKCFDKGHDYIVIEGNESADVTVHCDITDVENWSALLEALADEEFCAQTRFYGGDEYHDGLEYEICATCSVTLELRGPVTRIVNDKKLRVYRKILSLQLEWVERK